MPHNIQTFKDIQKQIDENLNKVYSIEAPLYSKHLGVAGRVDCVGMWNGKDSIIDWKTSRKEKKKEWVHGYFMQAAAYAIMWEERTGKPIKQLVVAIAGDEGAQIFIIKKLEGQIEVAKANVMVYTRNAAGIGEHVDIVETMELEIAKIAEAEDKIEAIKKHFK